MNDSKHPSEEWKQELEEAPFLQGLKRETVFQPPEGYFDKLEGELQLAMEDREVLKEAPQLNILPKKNIFQAPASYFEQFPERIMRLIGKVPLKPESRIRNMRFRRPAYLMAVAATISLLLLAGIWLRPSSHPLELDDIPVEELMAVVEWENISVETLMEVLGEDHLELDEAGLDASQDDLSDLLREMEDSELEDMLLDI